MLNEVFVGVLVSLLLGALVGAQREMKFQKEKLNDFAGFRTFTLICLFGYLLGYLSLHIFNSHLLIAIGLLGMFLLVFSAYRVVSKLYVKHISIINEVSALLVFVIGILVSLREYHLAITITILMTLILFLGNYLHKFAKSLTHNEVFASLKFAIISLVILPFLPNKNYTLLEIPIIREIFLLQNLIPQDILIQLDVFNPYTTWLMVIFISGIAYVGYILMRTVGAKRGMLLTGFLGGLMSSTALTSSFSIESKKLKYLSTPLAVGVIIACSTMFFRILFEVAVLNPSLLPYLLLPFTVMGLVGYLFAIYFYKREKINHIKHVDLPSPFTLGPALKFAFFFVFIIFFAKLFSIIFGEKGIYAVAFFSGIADVDAITISLSSLAASGQVSIMTAQMGIFIAALSNTFFKGAIAYFLGTRTYANKIMYAFIGLVAVGFLILLLA